MGGIASVNNLIFALMINAGAAPAGQEAVARQILALEPYIFLFTGVERVLAIVIQISLSMIVMKAVTDRKYRFFVLAILLHALIDFPAALYQTGTIQNLFLLEGMVALFALAVARLAWKLYADKRTTPLDMI